MKKIVMISQPMKGLGYNRIIFNRIAAVEYLEMDFGAVKGIVYKFAGAMPESFFLTECM